MKEFTCIVCPNGCLLEIDEETLKVKGNKCKRGETYAINEIKNPLRSLTTLVKTTIPNYSVLSVRTNGEIPKSLIFDAMKIINNFVLEEKVPAGTVIIKNILDTNVDVITTSNID